ncbi:MAG: CBS domain-containing protein [Gammaproteobacteria bacterium]|nr:CBS domain-containing protein [Gammaproteobacteria bacterium]
MSAGEYCNREVVVVARDESVRTAIGLMRDHHVGSLVVTEQQGETVKPVGILTDRDIVMEILAQDVAVDTVDVGDIMSDQLVKVSAETRLVDAVSLMKQKGVRRLPVVDADGGLVGILTVDDIIDLLSEQISNLVGLINNEQRQERATR